MMVDATVDTDSARKTAEVYVIGEDEIVFDAPVEQVWPHVLDYASWQNYASIQHVSGEPGQEGEVVLMEKEGVAFPFFAKTIKLDPGRRVTWKIFPTERHEENDYFGIVDFRLYAVDGGKTRFHSDSAYEYVVPYADESELDDFRKQRHEARHSAFRASLQRLKKLVEDQ